MAAETAAEKKGEEAPFFRVVFTYLQAAALPGHKMSAPVGYIDSKDLERRSL
jgi:hypothetical protein